MRSLLRQGAAKLRFFTRRPGVRELRERAVHDADVADSAPPKILVTLEGFEATAPKGALRVTVPRG